MQSNVGTGRLKAIEDKILRVKSHVLLHGSQAQP